MKKLIVVLLIASTLTSCKKDKGTCYICTFGSINGTTPPAQTVCGQLPKEFHDDQGNPLSSYCTLK